MDGFSCIFFPSRQDIFYVTLKIELNKTHDAVYFVLFQVFISLWPRYTKSCKFPPLHIPVLLTEHAFLSKLPSKHLRGPSAEYCVNKIKRVSASGNVDLNRWKWNYKLSLVFSFIVRKVQRNVLPQKRTHHSFFYIHPSKCFRVATPFWGQNGTGS